MFKIQNPLPPLLSLTTFIDTKLNTTAKRLHSKLPPILQNPTILALTTITFCSLLIFWKIPIKQEIPVPGDLLVSFYYPFYNGGFEGYDPWTRHKEFIASDAIRQGIPWRALAIDSFKNFHAPLWNPYNFSGTPLLANLQSAVFYPLNFIFFLLPFMHSWVLYIILQPILFAAFTYLFIRSLKLDPIPALLSSLAVTGSSYLIIWIEIGIVGHTILWLPLLLYATQKIHHHLKLRYLLIFIFAATASLFSGHFQTAMHTFILVGLYWLFKTASMFQTFSTRIRHLSLMLVLFGVAISITSIQLLPALELKPLSPMSEAFAKDVFLQLKTPTQNLLTFFAPDLFGNPATNNFSSDIYGDGTPFIGVIPLFFAIFALIAVKKSEVRFWGILAFAYLTYGFPGPLYHLARILPISLFTSTLASRSLIVVVFSLSVLSAYGLHHLLHSLTSSSQRRVFLKTLLAFAFIYVFIWLFILVLPRLNLIPALSQTDPTILSVAKRNLVLPSALVGILTLSSLLLIYRRQLTTIFLLGIFVPSLLFSYYHYNKTLPFSPPKFFFPVHSLISHIQSDIVPFRTIGFGTAKFDKNFSTYYQIFSPEGYDSLRIGRYAELIASQQSGQVPVKYSKSDADFIETENGFRKKILDLTSVKYIHDKNDLEINDWNPETYKFQGDNLHMVWQNGKFKLYERFDALERAYLVHDYKVISDPKDILNTLYDQDFDPQTTVILERPPSSAPALLPDRSTSPVKINSYAPNRITLSTDSSQSAFLVLTDAHYPGWKAYIDSTETHIYRANYAFRAIYLPSGPHQIEFIYSPSSFRNGLLISVSVLLSLTAISYFILKSKKLSF